MKQTIETIKEESISQLSAHLEKAYNCGRNRGYNKGYEEGKGQAWSEEVKKYEIEPDKKNEYIEQGRNEAWETILKIVEKPWPERRKALERSECRTLFDLFSSISASEAIKKIRKYEEQKKKEEDEIKVGDEVMYHDDKGVVVLVANNGKSISIMSSKGGWMIRADSEDIVKTGRTFPQIVEVLKTMQEG